MTTNDEDTTDPLHNPIEAQGDLVLLDPWCDWRAALAVECADACGCALYADERPSAAGEPIALVLVGVAEDARAAKATYRAAVRDIERSLRRDCRGKSDAWVARWAAERVEELAAERIDDLADLALERSYARREGGATGLVWEEEGEVEERAAAALAWMVEHLACDPLTIVPPAPVPEGTIDLAAFAARHRAS